MKCEEINFLEYLEGHAPDETAAHIEGCPRCHLESNNILEFSKVIRRHYMPGKRAEKELENKLKSIDCTKIKKMPREIEKKIIELKEKRLTLKLVDIFGKDKKTRAKFIENILTPQQFAIAASPKDITKAKKPKKRKKK